MKPGQYLALWWQKLVAGVLRDPQSLFAAAMSDAPSPKASDRFFGVPDDGGLASPKRLVCAPSYFTSDAALRQNDVADWQLVDVRLMRFAAVLVELARKRSVPLYVHCSYRGAAAQAACVASGASKTPFPRSAHNTGQAVDIVHGLFHWQLSAFEWAYIHVLGERALALVNASLPKSQKLVLNWGGDDGSGSDNFRWDPAHWEVADYRSRISVLPVSEPVRLTPRGILVRYKI